MSEERITLNDIEDGIVDAWEMDPEAAAMLQKAMEEINKRQAKLEADKQEIAKALKVIEDYNATNHAEALEAMKNKAIRDSFISKLTIKDFKACYSDEDIPDAIITAFSFGTKEEKINAFGNLTAKVFVNLYEYKQSQKKRTKAQSDANVMQGKIPESLAIPTLSNYQNSISLYQKGNAYLQPLTSVDKLKFKDGKMFFDGALTPVSEVELQNMKTKEGIEKIDLSLLRTFYSIILSAFEETNYKELKPIITMYAPDLAEYLGLKKNLNKQDINSLIDRTQQFHNIVGILHGTRNGKPTKSIFPVLNFEGYYEKTNTISFSSPYMNHVIRTVYNVAIRKDKKGQPKLKANGDLLRIPTHSYLVKSEISKERNKAAVENVMIIVTLIEQAGDNLPRIKASTIIERNPQLAQRLENSDNPRQLLQRTFKKTWELLQTKTRLQEVYKNIQLPDPNSPASIPTLKTLENTVFQFPHDGKNKTENSAYNQ